MAGGIAYLDISTKLLRDMLHLPGDSEILTSVEGKDGVVRVIISHDTIPRDATQVTGIYRSQHGVTFFERFDVVERGPRHDATVGGGSKVQGR